MQIELSREQTELVLEILKGRLDELRQEVRHSKVSTFSDQLKEKEALLKSVIHEMEDARVTSEV